jgi:hypothetical protein
MQPYNKTGWGGALAVKLVAENKSITVGSPQGYRGAPTKVWDLPEERSFFHFT